MLSFSLRLLISGAFVALAVYARLHGPDAFAGPRTALAGTRGELVLAWAGAGLGPWLLGCAFAQFCTLFSPQPPPSLWTKLRRYLLAAACAASVVGVMSTFLARDLAAALRLQGIESWPTVGQVFVAQLTGCLVLVGLGELLTRLRLGDGFVLLFCADLGAVAWLEAGAGTPRLLAGLLAGVFLPIWLKALTTRFEFDLHLGGETLRERYPIPGTALPYLQSLWLAACPVFLLNAIAPGLVLDYFVIDVIWLVAFCPACVFNVYFFMSLNHAPVTVVSGERRYASHSGKKEGRAALERDLNRWTLPTAISLTLTVGGPVALAFLGFQLAAVGVFAIFLAAVLLDLRQAWSQRSLADPVTLIRATRLLEAQRARDLLASAGIAAQVPGSAGWILFWDYGPSASHPVLVSRADLTRASELLENFAARWGALDIDAPARRRAVEAQARGEAFEPEEL